MCLAGGWSGCGTAMLGPRVYHGVCIRAFAVCPHLGSAKAL